MGESALYVLRGIEDMLQTEVKFFSMVRKDGERMCVTCVSFVQGHMARAH